MLLLAHLEVLSKEIVVAQALIFFQHTDQPVIRIAVDV
jgi:hypothetical protein